LFLGWFAESCVLVIDGQQHRTVLHISAGSRLVNSKCGNGFVPCHGIQAQKSAEHKTNGYHTQEIEAINTKNRWCSMSLQRSPCTTMGRRS